MFSHLIVSLIVVIGGLIFGYRYILSKYQNAHPQISRSVVKSVLGLPMLQFGIWALAFIPLWAFMPTHPKYDGGVAFWNSDLANWAIFRELGNQADALYGEMYLHGIGFLIFGGIATIVIYTLMANRILSNSTIKIICTTDTVFSTLAAWNMIGLPLIPIVGFLFSWLDSINARVVFIIIAEVILAIWIIWKAIQLQKNFNRNIQLLDNGTFTSKSTSSELTKQCPYCGETILAVAKKCKHCGEWIKEENVIVEVKKIQCPICGEMIEESATVCPYCNEKVEKQKSQAKNVIIEKAMAEKTTTRHDDKSNLKIWWIVGAVLVVGFIIYLLSQNLGNSNSSTNRYAGDSMQVEEVQTEVVEEYVEPDEIIEIPGMVQHTEDQGKYIPGDDDPWK